MAENALFGPLSGNPEVGRETGERAWLQALLDVERSLAAAQARAGLMPASAAAAIAACCSADGFDVAGLGRRALAAGNPVVPLVADLTALVPADAARYVHSGATSQDILDTAMMLVSRRAQSACPASPPPCSRPWHKSMNAPRAAGSHGRGATSPRLSCGSMDAVNRSCPWPP